MSYKEVRDKPEKGKKMEERNTLTEAIIGRDNHKGKNTPARESVKIPPDKWELPNPDLKDGKSDQTLAGECSKKDEQQSGPEREQHPGTKSQSIYFPLMGIFLAAAVACIAIAIFLVPPKNDMKTEFDQERVFRNGLENLQLSFINQTDRFWKILRSRGLAHLRNKDPSRPMFLLAAPPTAHEWVDCLAIKPAEMLDPRQKYFGSILW